MITKEIEKLLRAALAASSPLDALLNIALSMKNSGVIQQDVTDIFSEFRYIAKTIGDLEEDHVLESLDVITGFCPGHQRIF
jgi:hypothetical protein